MCIPTSLRRVHATRASRGKGVRLSVRKDTPIEKFKDFMRVGNNNKELFNMIADTIPSIKSNALLNATKSEHVAPNIKLSTLVACRCVTTKKQIAECLLMFMMHILMATKRSKL